MSRGLLLCMPLLFYAWLSHTAACPLRSLTLLHALKCMANPLSSSHRYGFIVMDGNGSLFGTLSGNTREILHKFTVDLPKKHGRGGQSALRFARLRMEKRHNYVRKASGMGCFGRLQLDVFESAAADLNRAKGKTDSQQSAMGPHDCRVCASNKLPTQVAEIATQIFITNDRPNVAGLIMAGSADFKTELSQSDLFDQRLQACVIGVVDVSYGGSRLLLCRVFVGVWEKCRCISYKRHDKPKPGT